MHDSKSSTPLLLKTKLYPPPVTSDLVPRTALLEQLESNRQIRPFTLISAPAGFGKSVLASMWLDCCDCPNGWVSIDDRDNDLLVFVAYLLAAVKMAFPDISLKSETLLEASTPLPTSVLMRSFLNDFDQIEAPFILVLDDLHLIHDKAIFDFLTGLMEHPPRTMHLVLISRQDPPLPVASLRAYRRITEIRMNDLRFKSSETAKLLEQFLQEEIDEALASEWTRQAEGWATALHLVALSLSLKPEKRNIGVLIKEKSNYLQEYLLAEVLNDIPSDRQTWLLKTALLDRFCVPLCDAVCLEEGEDLTGQTFMNWLQQSNLFLISLDDQGEWFRFHHLFQYQLKNQLQRQTGDEEIANLHLRASRWLAENGWVEEAIHHALLAGDSQTAVHIFSKTRYQLMNEDQWLNLDHLINLFPEKIVASNPMFLLTKAHVAILRSDYREIFSNLEQTQQLVSDLPQDSRNALEFYGEILTLQCIAAFISGQSDKIIAFGKMANKHLSKEAYHIRSVATAALMVGFQISGDMDSTLQVAKNALADPGWPYFSRAKIHLYLGFAQFMDADLHGMKRTLQETLRLSKNHESSDTIKSARYFLGAIDYLQNDLSKAESNLLILFENPATCPPSYLAHAAFILSRIYCYQNKPEEAHQILDLISTLFEELSNWPLVETIRAFRVELALDQGHILQAQQLSASIDFNARPAFWFYYIPQLTLVKLLYAQGTPAHLEKAQFDLEALEKQFDALNRKTIIIDVLAWQALVYEAQKNWQKAGEKLDRALRMAEPGGFIRNFVDMGAPMFALLSRLHRQNTTGMAPYISQILAAFPLEKRQVTAPDLTIHLTNREIQTLRLLATDLSPEEIAVKMTISPATVRTHIRNLYAKLEVNGRFQAVRRAQELGLLNSN